MKRLKQFCTIFILFISSTALKAQCLQIESILVDACNGAPCPPTATEGENEMVLFKVGSTALNINYMTTTTAILTPTWPNNSFKGWQTPGAITNPLVATLNATITKCGYLLQPVGGVLPANSQVLIITSTNMCTSGNSFANLTDTLYVLFQVAGNTAGHFANNDNSATITTVPTGSVSTRTLKLTYTGVPSCSESVTYDRSLLVNNLGTYGGSTAQNDGSTVEFNASGNATYVNNGCRAPYIPIQVSVTAPSSVCANGTVNINGTVSGPAYTYTWTTSGTGAISVPTGTLSGSGSATVSPTYTPGTGESGTVTFTLTAQGKCTLDVITNTVSVNILAAPTPVVSSSGGGAICSGNNTVLSVNNQTGVSYTWNPGSGSGTSFTVAPGATTVYTLTATNSCGAVNSTFTVDVHTLPTISVASASVCPGSTATITASGASTYTWNTGTVASSLSASPAATTNYTVTGTDVNGCVNNSTGTITVYNPPAVTVNSPAVCPGGTVTLNASGATTYTWSTAQTGNSISVSPSGNTSYTVTGTGANGCTNLAVSSVTINPLPVITVNSSTICPGNPTTLTAGGASTYTWSTAQTGNSISVNPASNTSYTVSGTDANGCVNTNTASVTVVNSLTVSAVPASTLICAGSSTTLSGNGASSYTWSPAGSLSSSTGTSVTASPTVATTYTVIGSSGSCSDTNVVTINVNNPPNVTGAASQTVICNGSSVTLNGNGASTYTWTGGVTNGVPFTPASTQTYTVTGTDANGCKNTAAVTITVGTLSITAVASATAICTGATSSATLTASGASGYSWSPNASLSSATGATVTATPTSNTTYTLVGSTGSCKDSTTITIAVNPLPVITAGASPTATVCAGGTVILNASGGVTYVWTGGVNNGVPFTPGASQTYTVLGTDANGCQNFASVAITVNPLPTVSVNSGTVCSGNSTTLTANGAATYSWSSGASGNSVSVSPATTSVYTVTGTSGNGCSAQATASVTVNNLPPVSVNDPSVCAGATATLTVTGASTYTWSTGSNGTSITASSSGNTSFTVSGTDVNGCVNTASSMVTVNPLPTVTAVNASMCQGGSAILSASGALTYTWSNGSTGSSVTVSPSSATVYTVTGTDVNGCTGQANASVTVNPLPNAAFGPGAYTGQVPVTISFTNTSTGSTALQNYWNFGNGDTSHHVNPGETYSLPGTYNVILMITDANGCKDTASAVVIVTDVPVVVVIPNIFSPNGDNINEVFSITATGIKDFNCKIYDRWGILMYEWSDLKGGWDGKNVSNGKDATDGTYYFILGYSDNKANTTTKQGYLQLVR
jgi:gliding motility-associated-like protein